MRARASGPRAMAAAIEGDGVGVEEGNGKGKLSCA